MSDNKLTKLDFAPGIKASNINKNFDVVHDWIKAERRRVGGAGIIDGFETTVDTENFTVTVSDGNYVSKDGEVHHVEGQLLRRGNQTIFPSRKKSYARPTVLFISPRAPILRRGMPISVTSFLNTLKFHKTPFSRLRAPQKMIRAYFLRRSMARRSISADRTHGIIKNLRSIILRRTTV